MYRQITAETTDEQIMAPVKQAQAALLEVVTEAATSEYQRGEALVKSAQVVYNAEIVASAAFGYRDVVRNTSDPMKAMEYLMRLAVRGADDNWSGRGNDSKRSAHDEVLRFVDQMSENIRYGN